MTIIDKSKFEPSPSDSPAAPTVVDLNDSASQGVEATSSSKSISSTSASPTVQPNMVKSMSPPHVQPSDGVNVNAGKRVLGMKRKFSTATDVLEATRPLLAATEEPNDSSSSGTKRLRLVESFESTSSLNRTALREVDGKAVPSKALHINIRPMIGDPFILSISDDSYVFELKDMIAERTGLTLSGIVLSVAGAEGRILADDEQTLKAAGIVEGTSLNLTVKVSSGVETTVRFESVDFGDDFEGSGDEVYDIVYHAADEAGSETIADFVRLLEGGTSSTGSGSSTPKSLVEDAIKNEPTPAARPEVIEITIPGSYSKISRLLDTLPRPANPLNALDSLTSLKISGEDGQDELEDAEAEDKYHDELIRSVLGPRGASIFQSPILSGSSTDEKPAPIASTITGSSSCAKCGRKCKLAQRFQCKCGETFCPEHRYYDKHGCTFDFKAKDRERVQQANPKVVKPKVEQI